MSVQGYANLLFEKIFTLKHSWFKVTSIVFQKIVRNERQTYAVVRNERQTYVDVSKEL